MMQDSSATNIEADEYKFVRMSVCSTSIQLWYVPVRLGYYYHVSSTAHSSESHSFVCWKLLLRLPPCHYAMLQQKMDEADALS